MNPPNPILPRRPVPAHPFLISGSLPAWEQLPQERQQELIQALAALLLALPRVQALWDSLHTGTLNPAQTEALRLLRAGLLALAEEPTNIGDVKVQV